jgi:hypothetical protein
MTPRDVDALSVAELQAFQRFMVRELREQARANRRR